MGNPATVPMIAPDGTSGEIPQDKVEAAAQAGFKRAIQMVAPSGQKGYIPIDRQQDAMQGGFKLDSAYSEFAAGPDNKQGTYKMNGPNGQVSVAYPRVEDAIKAGLAVDAEDKDRYGHDALHDPRSAWVREHSILSKFLPDPTSAEYKRTDSGIGHQQAQQTQDEATLPEAIIGGPKAIAKGIGGVLAPTAAEARSSPYSYQSQLSGKTGAPMTAEEGDEASRKILGGAANILSGAGQTGVVIGAPELTQMGALAATGNKAAIAALGRIAGSLGIGAGASYGAGQAADYLQLSPEAKELAQQASFWAGAGLANHIGERMLGGIGQAKPNIKGQNYSPDHAAAFEGAIAPATAMGKNFVPQEISPQALTPIRQTAARMSQGNAMEQATVRAATGDKTPPLQRIKAYQNIVQSSLDDLEAQHAPALAAAKNTPVDVKPIVQNLQGLIVRGMDAADVSAIRNLMYRANQIKTLGDLNTFRQLLNTENAPLYKMTQVQQGRTGVSVQAAENLGDMVRAAYYDNLQQATGKDFQPLKIQEKNLITTKEALQSQKGPLSTAEAKYRAPSTKKELAGDIVNVFKDPKTTVTRTFLPESPATKVSTLLQKSLADLPTSPPSPKNAGLLGEGAISLQAPASPGPTSVPPPFNYTTRAQRLGLLLPEHSGGHVLPYNPELTGGERLAALMQALRKSHPPALPAKAEPIILPPPRR